MDATVRSRMASFLSVACVVGGFLVGGDALAQSPRGILVVESTPAGAAVRVDGLSVGKTPLEVPVAAGQHTVVIDRPGYDVETRTVLASAGTRTSVVVGLQTGGTAARKQARRQGELWPWLAIGGGAAGMVAGTVLEAIDSDAVADNEQQPTSRNTATTGYVALGLGAAAATVGLVALLWPRRSGGALPAVAAAGDGTPLVGVWFSF